MVIPAIPELWALYNWFLKVLLIRWTWTKRRVSQHLDDRPSKSWRWMCTSRDGMPFILTHTDISCTQQYIIALPAERSTLQRQGQYVFLTVSHLDRGYSVYRKPIIAFLWTEVDIEGYTGNASNRYLLTSIQRGCVSMLETTYVHRAFASMCVQRYGRQRFRRLPVPDLAKICRSTCRSVHKHKFQPLAKSVSNDSLLHVRYF